METGQAIWAVGTMSGTSLDGVDAAAVLTDGRRVLDFGDTAYRPYSEDEREILRKALGKANGPEVDAATEVVEVAHVEVMEQFADASIFGFHGQTTLHRPEDRLTCQLGDGRVLTEALQTPVAWDFRSTDVTLGGQGAPLAPFYHFALAKRAGWSEPGVFLNIGGVANITWIDPRMATPDAAGACLAFDTGPGNALIDDLVDRRLGQRFDTDGALTQGGDVDDDRLEHMLRSMDAFFAKVPPKSLDRDDFAHWASFVEPLGDADAAATLAAGTALSIARAMEHCPSPPSRILVTGGGRKNPGLMAMLSAVLECEVASVESDGLDGDMIEAQAFGYLAVRVLYGYPTSAPGTTGVAAPVGGGKVSRPRAGQTRALPTQKRQTGIQG